MALSDRMDKTSEKLLNKFGFPIVIKQITKGDFNPDTGSYEKIETVINGKAISIKDAYNKFLEQQKYDEKESFRLLIKTTSPVSVDDVVYLNTTEFNGRKFKVNNIIGIRVQDKLILQKIDVGE